MALSTIMFVGCEKPNGGSAEDDTTTDSSGQEEKLYDGVIVTLVFRDITEEYDEGVKAIIPELRWVDSCKYELKLLKPQGESNDLYEPVMTSTYEFKSYYKTVSMRIGIYFNVGFNELESSYL